MKSIKYLIPLICIGALMLGNFGCDNDSPNMAERYELSIPDHFPDIPIPADNPLTVDKVELGKQ